jgi:uncharacterized protein involved in response to NO
MDAGRAVRLHNLPDSGEEAFVAIDGIDERIHNPIKQHPRSRYSDKSYCRADSSRLMSRLEIVVTSPASTTRTIVIRERQRSLMLRLWILCGLFFLLFPGTRLSFSNLMAISAHHSLLRSPTAWLGGHGHAEMFGWIGTFILGIGYYSQPTRDRKSLNIQSICFGLWTTGVALRWVADISAWHWRVLFPASAGFELIAVLFFLKAASHHKISRAESAKAVGVGMQPWIPVTIGTISFAAGVLFNFVECVKLAVEGNSQSFPYTLDQKYLVLIGWGFLVPIVWGFSAHWLPAFLTIDAPDENKLRVALGLDLLGFLCGVAGLSRVGTLLIAASAVTIFFALHLGQRPNGKAKVQGIHASFPSFVRLAFVWLITAGCIGIWAAFADQNGGIWGASRHALTVGFAATMVFAMGPRILPHFAGVHAVFSKRLMFLSLVLLTIGCFLRVSSEPLAYEGILTFAWGVLPISGMLELTAVLLFALNLSITLLFGKSFFATAATCSPEHRADGAIAGPA